MRFHGIHNCAFNRFPQAGMIGALHPGGRVSGRTARGHFLLASKKLRTKYSPTMLGQKTASKAAHNLPEPLSRSFW
jgi:hypothetical protein